MNIFIYRTLDANINRICEGLRVIEDIFRFELENKKFISLLKQKRHYFRENFSKEFGNYLLKSRDVVQDHGKVFSKVEVNRKSIHDLLKANFLRVQEGLRVIEEVLKTNSFFIEKIEFVKATRFEVYQIEKETLLSLAKKTLSLSNYGILSLENDFHLKKYFKTIKDLSLNCIEIQIKKQITKKLFNSIFDLKDFCSKNDIKFIIRDHLDLAILLASDGFLINNDWMNVLEVKKIYQGFIGLTINKDIDDAIKNQVDFIIYSGTNNIELKEDNIYIVKDVVLIN